MSEPTTPALDSTRLTARLVAVSDYFQQYRARRGSWACERHPDVAHYGKLAYLLQIDGFLYATTGDDEYLGRGLSMLETLSHQLRQVGDRWVFYPGLLNPQNASNNAIDSGAIVDSLADWWSRYADETPQPLADFICDAGVKVASSYLPEALEKLTNQALWAATGLSAAYRWLEPREEFRRACVGCLETAFRDQNEDGSFPYLPSRLRGQDHPSLHDVSAYYHSRHLSFLVDVAEKIDYEFSDEERDRLRRGADFLCALYGGDGRKSVQVEAKHWYWSAPVDYEAASSTFDLHALLASAALFSSSRYVACAENAAHNFLQEADADGAVQSHSGDENFQCKHFWSAHAAWVVKALRAYDVPSLSEGDPEWSYRGAASGVCITVTKSWHVQVRTRRMALTPLFGSYAAGAIGGVYHRTGSSDTNLLARDRFSFRAPGELFQVVSSGPVARVERAIRSRIQERAAYRFALALLRDRLRMRDIAGARRIFRRVFLEQARFLHGRIQSSFWSLRSEVEMSPDCISISTRMALPDGTALREVPLKKSYRLFDDRVEARLTLSFPHRGDQLLFIVPATAEEVELEGAVGETQEREVRCSSPEGDLEIRFTLFPGSAVTPARSTGSRTPERTSPRSRS